MCIRMHSEIWVMLKVKPRWIHMSGLPDPVWIAEFLSYAPLSKVLKRKDNNLTGEETPAASIALFCLHSCSPTAYPASLPVEANLQILKIFHPLPEWF